MKYTNGKKADSAAFPFKVEAPKPGDTPLEAWDWGSAGGGAAKGAKLGSVIGPWGTVIGGAVGGVAGGLMGGKAKEEEAAEQRKIEEQMKIQQRSQDRLAALDASSYGKGEDPLNPDRPEQPTSRENIEQEEDMVREKANRTFN